MDNYIFLYKIDFDSRNYNIKDERDRLYTNKVDMIDYSSNAIICTSNNVLQLSKDYGLDSRSIYKTLKSSTSNKYMLCDYLHDGIKRKVCFKLHDME